MHRIFTRTRTATLLLAMSAAAALIIPSTASAILAGAESNGLLVNSNATPEIQTKELDRAKQQGVKVIRANFGWSELAIGCANASLAQQGDPDNGCYNWSVLDSLVKLAGERKIEIMLSTSGVPSWLHPKGCIDSVGRCYYMGNTQSEFNKTFQAYGAFLKAAGKRYKAGSSHGTIKYWTIWNEPNSDTFWKPNGNAARYAQMVGYAAPMLKASHPSAKVAIGPTAPKGHADPKTSPIAVQMRPVNFIKTFQANLPKFLKKNPRKYIDAWAHNPYPLVMKVAPSKQLPAIKAPIIGLNNIDDLFRTLDSKPITKKLPVWATEFGWETSPDEVSASHSIPRALQAQFLAEAFDRLGRTNRVQIGIWYGLTDGPLEINQELLASDGIKMIADWQAGTYTMAGVAKPSFWMFQRPVSVPMGSVKKGTTVPVWGKSNLMPAKGKLVWCTIKCTTKAAKWHWITGTKRNKDGDITGTFRITQPNTYFAVYDGQISVTNGYGSLRRVAAR